LEDEFLGRGTDFRVDPDGISTSGLFKQSEPINSRTALLALKRGTLQLAQEIETNSDWRVELDHLLPPQVLAPYQFEYRDGKIRILQSDGVGFDSKIKQDAYDALIQQGQSVGVTLRQTNIDPRVKQHFDVLHEALLQKAPILGVGLLYQVCENISHNLNDDEVPVVVRAILTGYTLGVKQYLGQFDEWVVFSKDAASSNITDVNVRAVADTLESLAHQLGMHPEAVDPKIPETLKYLRSLVRDPGSTAKNTVYAAGLTIENFVAYSFSLLLEFANETVKSSSKKLSKVAVVAIVLATINAVTGGSTAISKITNSEWISDAIALVKKHIDSVGE
jgi:hypothetical protein